MFSHVMVGTNDLAKAKQFYDAAFGALGVAPGFLTGDRVFYRGAAGAFGVTKPIDGQPASVANGGTIGFACASAEQVDAWHQAGVANGGETCESPPGPRETPAGSMYLAYMRDPDGNKLCAMYRPG